MKKNGRLYLIPSPLGQDGLHTLPAQSIYILHQLNWIVAERAKTARQLIKATAPDRPIHTFEIMELNEHTPEKEFLKLLQPALDGHDVGILSDAGCPAVADPGTSLVRLAHRHGVEVCPLSGPSAILLALMGSGLNGQCFTFHGYLSARTAVLNKDLKRLEQQAERNRQTQIFIETPYRNQTLVEQALRILLPDTLFCMAIDLTLSQQFIATKPVAEWKNTTLPPLHKRPAVFLIGRDK